MNMQNRSRSAPILSSLKLTFFKHRFFETITGGLNFESNGFLLILIKILIYLLPLLLILIPGLLADFAMAINISGGAAVLLLLLINFIQFLTNSNDKIFPVSPLNSKNTNNIQPQKKTKTHIYIGLLIILAIMTYFYFFLTCAFLWQTYHSTEISSGIRNFEIVLICLVTLTGSASLFLSSPKEFATVLPDDNVFNIFSTILMRPCYVIIILIIHIGYDGYWFNIIVSIIYFSLLPLWTFGILGGLINTLLWCIETINRFLFGDVLKIKFESLIEVFIYNWVLSVILTITLYFQADSACLIFYLIMTEVSMIKSFHIPNFLDFNQSLKEILLIIMIGLVAAEVIGITLGLSKTYSGFEIYFQKSYQTIMIILGIISAVVCLINWIIGIFHQAVLFKIINNPFRMKKFPTKILKILFRLSQVLISLFVLSFSYGRSYELFSDSDKNLIEIWVWSTLLLRSFNLCWYNHMKLFLILLEGFLIVLVCDLEPYWFIYFSPLLEIGNGFFIRMSSRTLSFFYSLYKMKTTKSLRLVNPNRFIILSLTVLLPINLVNIFITSLFNIPIIGIFGLPLFFSGSLRPHRLWMNISSSFKPDFESYLYKALLEQLKKQIKELIYRYPNEFHPEDYYLIRMGKFLAIFNVIERGFNYIGLNFRGLEMQEPTSCHNLEANSIDDIIKSVYDSKKIFYSHPLSIIEPLSMISSSNYDDNSFRLTGVIESRDFNQGLKELYLKLMIYNFRQWGLENSENYNKSIELLHNEISGDVDMSELIEVFPENWSKFLQKESNFEEVKKDFKDKGYSVKTDEESLNGNVFAEPQPEFSQKNVKKEILPQNFKSKSKDEDNGMLLLLDDLESIGLMKNEFDGNKTKKIEPVKMKEPPMIKTLEQKTKELIIYLFANSLNQRSKNLENKLNEETIYKLFKDGGLLNSKNWGKVINPEDVNKAIHYCQKAFRLSLKIALEIYAIEGHLTGVKNEELQKNIEQTENLWFIGNRNSEELFEAIGQNKANLMCLIYDFSKKETNVLRATNNQLQGHLLKLNEDIIKSIWSNVLFELLYATNDDEERYSIQSHNTYLRNLIIQSSEEPFGYCPFYSGPIIVDF